jgi:hypothetical protein
MSFFYPLTSYINLSPLHSPQYFFPFGINLQKGTLYQKEEIMVDKWRQEVGKRLAYRISPEFSTKQSMQHFKSRFLRS